MCKYLRINVIDTIVATTCKVNTFLYYINMEEITYLAKAFGEVLRIHRERSKLTQIELAARIGSVSSYIRYLEYGQKMPTINTFHHLCEALNVDPHEFMSDYVIVMNRMKGHNKLSL